MVRIGIIGGSGLDDPQLLQNYEELRVIEEPSLTDEIRITLGMDQATAAEAPIANGDITVSVLNGTYAVGAAKRLSDTLTADGFKLVGAGNAKKRDYQKTAIYYSPANLEKANILREALNRYYAEPDMQEDPSVEVDAQIIIGAE